MSSPTKWADGPWSLIKTANALRGLTTDPHKSMHPHHQHHPAHFIANEMLNAHNAMIRGLNSIYLQARHIPKSDAHDFLFLIKAWSNWILDHHILEEERMFPGFEAVPGVKKGALDSNVDQHHAFSKGLQNLKTYAETVHSKDYDGVKVIELIDDFGDDLHKHLHSEIETLMALSFISYKHGLLLLKVYKGCEAQAGKQDRFVVPPMVFGLCDKTYEGGSDWPRLAWGSEFAVNWILGWKHKSVWRFLPCDLWRTPKRLEFTGD